MSFQHICFFVPGYPSKRDPRFVFVRELICAIADRGKKCTVIAPQSITASLIRKREWRPFFWKDITDTGSIVNIYQPVFFSFSNFKLHGKRLSDYFFERSAVRQFERLELKPDVLYGHFWSCGLIAGKLGQRHHLPVFLATGESTIMIRKHKQDGEIQRYVDAITGVICVSSKNMEESLNLNLVPKEKMTVIPNAVNKNRFYPIDKSVSRQKLGFRKDDFIVVFVGHFDQRKGVLRLSEAIKKVEGVKSIFIGSGKLKPDAPGILFCGKLPHDQIVHYLNASDVFVLPTLTEGCCNAIIEAMACGLPIISSDRSFNDDILDDKNSIRIDSTSVEQIAKAIKYLKENPQKRVEMAKASLEKADQLDIQTRARKILEFIEEKIGEQCY